MNPSHILVLFFFLKESHYISLVYCIVILKILNICIIYAKHTHTHTYVVFLFLA